MMVFILVFIMHAHTHTDTQTSIWCVLFPYPVEPGDKTQIHKTEHLFHLLILCSDSWFHGEGEGALWMHAMYV